jgi:hypothetical protein
MSSFQLQQNPGEQPDKARLADNPRLLDRNTSTDARGSLSSVEITEQTGVQIKRVFWLHDLNGKDRGGHAHIDTDQVAIVLQGNVDIEAEKDEVTYRYSLNDQSPPLYLPRLTWVVMQGLSKKTIILVASSTKYDISRSLRSYDDFKRHIAERK